MQTSNFTVEQAISTCCAHGHADGRRCDRQLILQCISSWFGSVTAFELCAQTKVRTILANQLANVAVAYSRVMQSTAPLLWILFDSRVLGFGEGKVRHYEIIRAFTYWLAVVPCIANLMLRLCYHTRARCCNRFLDTLLTMTLAEVGAFVPCVVAFLEDRLYEQIASRLSLSLILLIIYGAVAALLWQFTPSRGRPS